MSTLELKGTKNLLTSVKTNVQPGSERNESNNQRVYDILFPGIEAPTDPIINNDGSHKHHEKALFGSVSTLDWLVTWRPLEIN